MTKQRDAPGQWSLAKNMADWSIYLALDIVGDFAFGRTFGMLDGEENRFAIGLIAASSRASTSLNATPWVA